MFLWGRGAVSGTSLFVEPSVSPTLLSVCSPTLLLQVIHIQPADFFLISIDYLYVPGLVVACGIFQLQHLGSLVAVCGI